MNALLADPGTLTLLCLGLIVAGALIGVRFAMRRGTAAIRWVIVAAVVLTALKLFGVVG